jgi:putative transcriptional regulator
MIAPNPYIKSLEVEMIQCRLRELMGGKGRRERRRITYDDILAQAGVSKNTLTRLANDKAGMVGISVIDRLCSYFDCQPGDLFIHVEEPDST